MNSSQLKVDRLVAELEAQGKPVRLIILKARQIGFSTWAQSKIFKKCSSIRNYNAKTVAHLGDATSNLFEMSKRFYEHLPEQVVFPDGSILNPKPKTRYSSKQELVFDNLDSSMRLLTAESKEASRSGTSQALHCSEVAFWKNPEANMTALLQTLPNLPGTFAVIESTANGVGGYFYDLWQKAKAGESGWIPVFVAWWEHEEYTLKFKSQKERAEFAKTLTEEEKQLIELYDLTLEQLNWRRDTIENSLAGDVDKFRQEYPSDDVEAFLTSGRPYFEQKTLQEQKSFVSDGVKGSIELIEGTYRTTEEGAFKVSRKTKAKFIPDESGYIELFGYPGKYGAYCIGADVAEGLATGDYSAGIVLDRDTGQQVAEWHGHIDPDLFGQELVKLAIYFNQSWIAPEVNNHGISTVKAIERTGYRRLYRRQSSPELMDVEIKDTDRLGWRTDKLTRPVMLNDLKQALREQSFLVSSKSLLKELRTFVFDSKGKPQAQAGAHDDLVMASGIALQAHAHTPVSRPISEAELSRRRRDRKERMKPKVSSVTGW